ncbi:hypothetical protein [Stieleria varia]|uniref:Uncharacterized protein n=1 Tax=Stieleria varia TaxID=2528005 RepID=A0A5C5ZZ39_9BACT|nr:hypothetical protein [Stieleria varia]TWT92375.1 hypothetical protein Pla52n_62490 [Stieleria varia]
MPRFLASVTNGVGKTFRWQTQVKRWATRIIEPLIVVTFLAVLVVGGGFVSFTYDNVIDNDPLIAPLDVAAVDGDRITLSDGRILIAKFDSEYLQSDMEQYGNRVDLDPAADGSVIVNVSYRRWKCGNGGPWLRLRWIPIDYPLYRRAQLGLAQIENQP